MKSVLLGNGINIQFGGLAYNSDFIMKRIKYGARLDRYNRLFGNIVSGKEIENLLNDFVPIANDIRLKKYNECIKDPDTLDAIKDFQKRYQSEINVAHEIMLEDWFLIVNIFFLVNRDLDNNIRTSGVQAFEYLIIDAIFNNGQIQKLYAKMNKKVSRYFKRFDNIFTLNYDNNIENLTQKQVYHLHGDFSVLSNSENNKNVLGYIREKKGELVCFSEMRHCFCNALLNYSGKLKYKVATEAHKLIVESENFLNRYYNDEQFKVELEQLKAQNPFDYELIMTKIEHPELNMATEYHFKKLENIRDELYIIGMSPNNDGHIFELILNNPNLTKVIFYYFNEKEKKAVEDILPRELLLCRNVNELWESLGSKKIKYNCNYKVPDLSKNIIDVLNILSDDVVDFEQIKKEINKIPQFEMKRLCGLVKDDMLSKNPTHIPINEKEFMQQSASISYIALQQGVLPSVLYLICIMNFDYIKD